MAPGMIVSVPAAASTPQSVPPCCSNTARILLVIGVAAERVSVSAIRYSTHENMKQKKAATPMPEAISGMKMRVKKLGKL